MSSAILVQVAGSEDKRHVFRYAFAVGQSEANQVCLQDDLVKPVHAIFYPDGPEGWFVRATEGAGLVVDTMRVRAASVGKGSRIEVGLTTLVVVPF